MLLVAATATVLAIAVAVLFAPVSVDLLLLKDADVAAVDVRGRLRWMGVSVPLHRGPSRAKPGKPRRAGRPGGHAARRVLVLLGSPGFIARSTRLLVELASRARPVQFDLETRVGFDDPSETGLLMGCLGFGLPGRIGYRVHIEPDFSAEVLAGRLRVRWSRSIAGLTWPVVKYLASPVVWRAVRRCGKFPGCGIFSRG